MAKLRSHSGAKKRLRRTGGGRIAFKRNSRNHLLLQKSRRQKRINRTRMLHHTNEYNLARLIPNL